MLASVVADAVWVVVLAAGQGRRAGGPKLLRQVGGEPWWVRQHRRLDQVGLKQAWVTSPGAAPTDLGECVILVESPSTAPMFLSIVTGLARVRRHACPSGAFILPVDVPAAEPEVWDALAAAGDRPTVPRLRGSRGHPVYLPWRFVEDHLLSPSEDPESIGRRRLDHLIQDHVAEIEVEDERIAMNLNTAEDFAAAEVSGLLNF